MDETSIYRQSRAISASGADRCWQQARDQHLSAATAPHGSPGADRCWQQARDQHLSAAAGDIGSPGAVRCWRQARDPHLSAAAGDIGSPGAVRCWQQARDQHLSSGVGPRSPSCADRLGQPAFISWGRWPSCVYLPASPAPRPRPAPAFLASAFSLPNRSRRYNPAALAYPSCIWPRWAAANARRYVGRAALLQGGLVWENMGTEARFSCEACPEGGDAARPPRQPHPAGLLQA